MATASHINKVRLGIITLLMLALLTAAFGLTFGYLISAHQRIEATALDTKDQPTTAKILRVKSGAVLVMNKFSDIPNQGIKSEKQLYGSAVNDHAFDGIQTITYAPTAAQKGKSEALFTALVQRTQKLGYFCHIDILDPNPPASTDYWKLPVDTYKTFNYKALSMECESQTKTYENIDLTIYPGSSITMSSEVIRNYAQSREASLEIVHMRP